MSRTLTKTAEPAYDGSTPAPRAIARGRPRKDPPPYSKPAWRETPPENVALEIERLAATHMDKDRIAVELGVGTTTFRRWLADDPTLEQCFALGMAKARHELYMLIVEDARLGKKLNMPAVFALNTRHGFRMEKLDDARPVNVNFINYRPTVPLADFIDSEAE